MNSKYLAIGSNIAGKYEVIEVLGEDDFEILYLVRDIQRKRSFFVLKELFLETFSSREDQVVFTTIEAIGVFNKRRIQIISEINSQKLTNSEIKVYGFEEANETIYTIMEFSNNAGLEKYLQFVPKDAEKLPTLDELLSKEKKTFNGFFFLKFLLFIGVLLGIAFYAYQFLQKSKIEKELEKSVTMDYPTLRDRREESSINIPKKTIEVNEPIVNTVKSKEDEKHEPDPFEGVIFEEDEKNTTLKSEVIEEVKKEKVKKEETKNEPNLLKK